MPSNQAQHPGISPVPHGSYVQNPDRPRSLEWLTALGTIMRGSPAGVCFCKDTRTPWNIELVARTATQTHCREYGNSIERVQYRKRGEGCKVRL